MADEVVATFDGPLDSYSINLMVENASTVDVLTFGISGYTAKFPITWDSVGEISGRPAVSGTEGEDTEVFLTTFTGFGPGLTVNYGGMDPDFTHAVSAGVRVLDMCGSRATVFFSDSTTGFGEFHPTNDGKLRAVITRP